MNEYSDQSTKSQQLKIEMKNYKKHVIENMIKKSDLKTCKNI